ncbi:MAG: hypothetical protein HY925_02370 [Elusimicrobia bacterium]|nr:hypothetical protein [Elusimicrobiota bacterium]
MTRHAIGAFLLLGLPLAALGQYGGLTPSTVDTEKNDSAASEGRYHPNEHLHDAPANTRARETYMNNSAARESSMDAATRSTPGKVREHWWQFWRHSAPKRDRDAGGEKR